MDKRYYRLNPECYLVKGTKNGIIINIYEGKAISIDEAFSNILLKLEHGNPIEERHENLYKLIEMGWADEYDAPVFIDKIRVTNVFGKRHMWKSAPIINLAVLQITGNCEKDCPDCLFDRCPACKKDTEHSPIDLESWKMVIDRLTLFNTNTILLTGGNPILNSNYEKILDYAVSKKINTFIHVSSVSDCEKVKEKYNVFLSVMDDEDITKLGAVLKKKKNIFQVFVNEKKAFRVTVKDKKIHYINSENLKIHKSNMFSLGIDPYRFALKQMYNECFFGKICINQRGDILPCLKAGNPVGNFLGDNFIEGLKRLIENYWYVSVDDKTQEFKCTRCENRYVCRNLCTFSPNKDECSYHIEESKWSC